MDDTPTPTPAPALTPKPAPPVDIKIEAWKPRDGRRRRRPLIGETGYERIPGDLYRTPAWVTDALVKHIRIAEPMWEPAAGMGDMVTALRAHGRAVIATDVADEITIENGVIRHHDFLAAPLPLSTIRSIVTNPPYSLAEQFIRRALELMKSQNGQVAMLLHNDFDTALRSRGDLFRMPAFAGKLMLGNRIQWVGLHHKASPRQSHSWFLWDWLNQQPPVIYYATIHEQHRVIRPRKRKKA